MPPVRVNVEAAPPASIPILSTALLPEYCVFTATVRDAGLMREVPVTDIAPCVVVWTWSCGETDPAIFAKMSGDPV